MKIYRLRLCDSNTFLCANGLPASYLRSTVYVGYVRALPVFSCFVQVKRGASSANLIRSKPSDILGERNTRSSTPVSRQASHSG